MTLCQENVQYLLVIIIILSFHHTSSGIRVKRARRNRQKRVRFLSTETQNGIELELMTETLKKNPKEVYFFFLTENFHQPPPSFFLPPRKHNESLLKLLHSSFLIRVVIGRVHENIPLEQSHCHSKQFCLCWY